MSKKRWLVLILLIVAVVLAFVGLFVYSGEYRREPLTLSLNQYPQYVNSPIVHLSGHVSHEARIELTRNNSSLGTIDSHENKFEIDVELEQGENQIRVSARPMFDVEPIFQEILIVWEPKNPPTPALHPLPQTTNVPGMTITGATYPNGNVELVISPDPEGTPAAYYVKANKDGSFQTQVRLPAPGAYKITSATYNFLNVRSAPSPEHKVVYDPEWYPVSSPAQTPKSRRIIRKADIVLTHKQMTMTLAATLPRDDRAVAILLANQSSLDQFFQAIFGLEINNEMRGEFYGVVPQIVIKDHDATITATTSAHYAVRDYLPVLQGDFVVGGHRGFPFSTPDDSLSITVHDYTIESIGPPPTILENNKLTWTGSGTRPLSSIDEIFSLEPTTGQIKLQLEYNPFASPRNFLRLAQVSPYSFWRFPGNAIPHFLLGLSRLIPMLWVLWLVVDSRLRKTIETGLRNDLQRLSKLLITFSLIGTVLAISAGLSYFVSQLEIRTLTELRNVLEPQTVAIIAILLLALLLQLVTWRASNRSWAMWLARITAGIRNAAFICLLLQPTWFLRFNKLISRGVGIAIVVVTLGFLFLRTGRIIRHAEPSRKHKVRLAFLMLIILTMFVVPIAVPDLTFDPRWSLYQSFAMLQSMLPYALAIGLLIVLKNVNGLDQRRTRHLVLTIGLILFSGFLVGPTAHLFMIPVPFIISIFLFRRFLIYDFERCGELDSVNSEVVTDRRRLIGDVLSYETAQHFQAHIEKLKDKVTSGDMSLKEFEDRKSEIEKYAFAKELASTHVNGLHAKATVLGIGPHTEDWKNGRWCLKWAAALIAPFLIAYVLMLLLRPTSFADSVTGFVFGLDQLLNFVADWLLSAFFFGYYFRYIRGNSGAEKGLRIAVVMIVCFLPSWLTGVSNYTELLGVLVGAVQTFLFFTLLGMVAFDYVTFRNALRDQFRWRTFARFGNMPSFTAVVSVLITSVGLGLTSVITGQFKDLFTTLLGSVFQQAPGPPT